MQKHHSLPALFVGLLLSIAASIAYGQCRYFDGFTDAGEGAVLDPRSGLVWQRCATGQTWDGNGCHGTGAEVKWVDAVVLASHDRTQGLNDWRLPTRRELESVVGEYQDCSQNDWLREKFAASPMIASRVKGKYPGFFWSLDTTNPAGTEIFVTNFIHGQTLPTAADGHGCCNVKLVRGGSGPAVADALSTQQAAYEAERQRVARVEQEQRNAAQIAQQRKEAEDAKRRRIKANADLSAAYLEALRCEEGKRLSKSGAEDERPRFDFEECMSERKYRALEASRDAQAQYLAAVRYEADGERPRAKTLYLTIMERHASHAIALKAADRLAAMTDVIAVERSNAVKASASLEAARAAREAAQESQGARSSVDKANRDAGDRASRQCRDAVDACYARRGDSCYRDCDALRR